MSRVDGLIPRLPGFHLAWLSCVRDVSVLLGLTRGELAARRNITIDDARQVSLGPVALDADPPPAFAGILASLATAGRGNRPPSVERLAAQVIRDAEGRSAWRDPCAQEAASSQGVEGARPTGLFLNDLNEVMLAPDVGGALWS